ncbi:MAG TPA: hypothetical protein VK530_06995 [Candidatus Acidoferrum sp.]|nr:hypothetical protein [Candidatus Acidoferrum sp.]
MKLLTVFFLSALSVAAQPPPTDAPSDVSEPVTSTEFVHSSGLLSGTKSRERTSGALVNAARVKNPAQLLNPRAPKEFGDGWDNVSFDVITGQGQGLKLFAIHF